MRWLCVMVLAPVPWAGAVWALPFLSVLAPSERVAQSQGRRHKPLTDQARQALLQTARWLPGRTVIAVAAAVDPEHHERHQARPSPHLHWVHPHFWCNTVVGCLALPMTTSCGSQNSASQQVVLGSPVHLPLHPFQSIDLPLDRAGAPRFGQRGAHRADPGAAAGEGSAAAHAERAAG